MTTAVSPCRAYIVYHHGLFAQGVRSVLQKRRTVQVVGMESDVMKAVKAVRSLHPDVIIVEEPTEKAQSVQLGPFLEFAAAGRVVTLNLTHQYATVYDRHRVAATDPTDLVKAMRGARKRAPSDPEFEPPERNPWRGVQSAAGRARNEDPTGRGSRVRRVLKQEEQQPQPTVRPRAGKGKAG
jgi:chemotaxis response regulator CheB